MNSILFFMIKINENNFYNIHFEHMGNLKVTQKIDHPVCYGSGYGNGSIIGWTLSYLLLISTFLLSITISLKIKKNQQWLYLGLQ